MMIRTITIFLIQILFVSQNVQAQFEHFYDNWRWSHFTTSSGLPSDIVEKIIETEDHTPWVSTAKGLAWYDGYRWIPAVVDSAKPDHRVREIVRFGRNTVLALLDGSVYEGSHSGFRKLPISDKDNLGTVTSIAVTDSATVFCAVENSDSAYVIRLQHERPEWFSVPPPGKFFQSEYSAWYSPSIGSSFFRCEAEGMKRIFREFGEEAAVRSISENSRGEGVLAVDAPKNIIGIWEFKGNNAFYSVTERNQPVRAVSISEYGEAVAVYESGEIHLRIGSTWRNLDPIPRQMANVLSVHYRFNNDLWVTTEKGLYLFKREKNEWQKNDYAFSDLRNVVMEVFRSSTGDLWIGNMNGLEIHRRGGATEFITHINGIELGLVTGINEDRSGHLWICAGGGAKGFFEWNGAVWRRHFGESINYHKIRKDRSGDLWFLGLALRPEDPAGYILNNSKLIRIDSMFALPSNRVYSFAESKKGSLWIGTTEGLVKYSAGKRTVWAHEAFGRNAKIFTMAVDSSDILWFSTFSSYLGKITAKDDVVWVWKKEEQHEYNEKIWDLVFDRSEVLWLASTKGLFRCYNDTWSNYGNRTGSTIKELRVVLPAEDRIYVGGHGIGVHSIQRMNERSVIKTTVADPIVEDDAVYCSWSPASFWGNVPQDEIETRYSLNGGPWSSWSTLSTAVLNDLPSGWYSLSVQAKDLYGNVYDASSVQQFEVEPPLIRRPIFVIPMFLLSSLILVISLRSYQAKKRHKQNMENHFIRISNDLHDEVGSNLGSISLISQRLIRRTGDTPGLREDLTIIGETAIQTAEELRDIVWYINPKNDSVLSLDARLREIAERLLRGVELQFTMNDTVNNDIALLSIRRNIILMFKEILHNVMRHAKARTVSVSIEHQPNIFTIIVADDGIGFDQTKEYPGNGMKSIRRRIEEVNGKLKIESVPGKGTTVTVSFMNYTE